MRKAAAPIGFNKKGPSEESGEMAILPSTSTFTLSGKDDKPEKLKKKAKNFLDERQKIKSRAQSLWSFIGMFFSRLMNE
jgi:hypothetical protein